MEADNVHPTAQPDSSLTRWVPAVKVIRSYQAVWLRADLAAGLVLAALLVPSGVAYAELAGLPPVHGLYATMIPLIAYALFGPSRILVIGPDSAVAPVVAAAIIPIAGDTMSERIALAGLLAIIVGIFCIAGGLAGFGFVTDLISKPVRMGYLAGIGVTVTISQISGLLEVPASGTSVGRHLVELVRNLDQINPAAAIIGCVSLVLILIAQRLDRRIPIAMIVALVGITIVALLDPSIATVGAVQTGLPTLTIPNPETGDLARLVLTALAISLLAFADTSVLSRSYAARTHESSDQNQELLALGVANLSTGFFQGFPISGSSSRTPVAESAGSKTQLTGVVGAIALGFILAFAGGLLKNLPTSVLAAIIIGAVVGLIDLAGLRRLARVHRADFVISMVCLGGVVGFGVLWGIGIAIGLSIFAFLWNSWHPYDAVLGRSDGVKGYHDVSRHPEARQIPGLVLYRFDAPLFFANAGIFRERVLDVVHKADRPVNTIVIAAEPITDLDSTAADMLQGLSLELEEMGVNLAFAEVKGPVKDHLRAFGLFDEIGHERFYPTIGMAVHRYVIENNVDWVDWEEANAR